MKCSFPNIFSKNTGTFFKSTPSSFVSNSYPSFSKLNLCYYMFYLSIMLQFIWASNWAVFLTLFIIFSKLYFYDAACWSTKYMFYKYSHTINPLLNWPRILNYFNAYFGNLGFTFSRYAYYADFLNKFLFTLPDNCNLLPDG